MAVIEEIEELKRLVALLLQKIEALEAENAVLKEENAQLQARLGLNSTNSHQPPSTDGLRHKPAFARQTGKKSGGQPGHPGHTLTMSKHPDEVIVHHASHCPCCQQVFRLQDVVSIAEKRQVFDLPAPRVLVTEHQIGVVHCCGHSYRGTFPEAVTAPIQYGVHLSAMSSLLNTDFRLPFEKISRLFYDLYGCPYNESTAIRANEKLYAALAPVEEEIKKRIKQSPVVHFDETGMRVAGQLHWFHTACTSTFCYLFVHPKRGKQALNQPQSLLPGFQNWAIHDGWASYFAFTDCQHALCNAHIIRELTYLIEQGSRWAAEMRALLLELYQVSEKGRQVVDNPSVWIARYQHLCQRAEGQEPQPVPRPRGKPKNSKGRNLLNRLLTYQQSILAFAFVEAVPFTNNRAEQAIRCLKVKQKVAMSFRKLKGAQVYARLQGFISTCRKQNNNSFQQLVAVLLKQKITFDF